jgi:pyruvate dehydrogenase E1 component beta subunit
MPNREITMIQAMHEAIAEEMRRDPTVFLMGEDVRLSIYGTSKGLVSEFGPERVRNTPLSEAAFVGAGIGAAIMGMRPIVDLMVGNFTYVAMDQLCDQAAKIRYMSGGQCTVPVVYLATTGAEGSAAGQHSDSPYSMFMNMGGFKVVLPSTPYDAKGLLKAAIRDDNPVLYFEPLAIFGNKGPVPEGEFIVPLGVADVKRPGTDLTIVAIGALVKRTLAAAAELAGEGISAEVMDPRTLVPLDATGIVASVRKTGRLVVVDEARHTCGAAAEIGALVAEEAFDSLLAPIRRVTAPDTPVPFSPVLEQRYVPDTARIVEAAHQVVGARRLALGG